MPIIYGVAPSPYVRKTMLAHRFKGVAFDMVTMSPGSDDPDFRAASPLGKIPGYQLDSGTAFSDSSVIIAYLERTATQQPLYPENAEDFARALWLEEYCDTKFSEVVSAIYYQRVIGPVFFQHTTDQARVTELVETLIPQQLDYLESVLQNNAYFIGERFSVADLAVGSHMLSLHHAQYEIDAVKWPALSAFAKAFIAKEAVQQQLNQENAMLGK